MRTDPIEQNINAQFGGKLRVRASGVLVQEEKILMLKHLSLGEEGYLWVPPGGGVAYGERLEDSLRREFWEETGLEVQVKEFLFLNEFIAPPLHALEVFFKVEAIGGSLKQGTDPEMPPDLQIISAIAFLSAEALAELPAAAVHRCFRGVQDFEQFFESKKNFYANP